VQGIFIVFIALFGAAATGALFWLYRGEMKRIGLALAGFGFLASFIVVRAASFHHVDQILNFAPGGVRMNWIFELCGIAMIAWPAWKAARRSGDTGFVWVPGRARS
jgi:hypothetical protein